MSFIEFKSQDRRLDGSSGLAEGVWEGLCTNTTFRITAPLTIFIHQKDTELVGTLMLGGDDLIGSGAIHGIVHGGMISFTSPGDDQSFKHIIWNGFISDKALQGVYRVEPTGDAASSGFPVQHGTFQVFRK